MNGLHEDQIPQEINPETGLPIGPTVDARPAAAPERVVLDGRYCRLEPLDWAQHGQELFAASSPTDAAQRFQYLPEEPPRNESELANWVTQVSQSSDPLYFAVIDKRTGRVEGRQTLMRIQPDQRCIEIGNIYWGPAISRSPVTTEANFLFARYIFDELGYRRYEWKCNALNAPSRRAALRFGFRYEGLFRRAVIVRGRTRDTTWYSVIEEEWPGLKAAYEQWLAPDNFDTNGQQKTRLTDLTRALGS
ncbi:MAG: GNAT family protein [Pseudomonadota bacterium]